MSPSRRHFKGERPRRKTSELARLVQLLENYQAELKPLVQGEGAHGPIQAVVDAANHLIDQEGAL